MLKPTHCTISIIFILMALLGHRGVVASPHNISDGTVYNGNPANYRSLLDVLAPGDTLVLEAGIYTEGLPIYGLNGTAAAPIIIRGPESGPRAIFEGRACCNTIEIQDSSYVAIYHLELDGNQLDAVDGVKASGDANVNWAHHITLENLLIHDHDASQQTVGISTKIPAWDWIIRRNIIDSAGTGMYLGDSNGSAPFVNGLIEGNLVVDTPGYNVQIKHQIGRPDLPGLPAQGTTIIRHNVFSKAANAAIGADARPNLLVGHWPLSGNGANDVYEIYGNFFYQNPTPEPLFQGEGHIALYDNLLVTNDGANGEAIWIQAHEDQPRSIDVFNNTIVATNRGIRVSGVNTAYPQRVVGNAVFAPIPLDTEAAVYAADNVVDSWANAGSYLVNPTGTPGNASDPLDLFPLAGALAGNLLNTTPFHSFMDWNRDFNSVLHDGAFRGAYAGEGVNPGWLPRLERKPLDLLFDLPYNVYLPLVLKP